MDETKKIFHWITMDYAGYFKDLHTKSGESKEKDLEQSVYSEFDKIEIIEFYCNVLKAVVLSMYPKARQENWYLEENGKYAPLPEVYLKFIPQFKGIIDKIKTEVAKKRTQLD